MTASLGRSTALAALVMLAALPALARAQESGIAIGERAPGAIVETLDGARVDLARYLGKTPVLLEFWATWCPSCEKLEPALVKAHRKYGKRVRFVGVAVAINQSPERVRRYVQRHKLTHDIVYDRTGDAATRYDVPATSYVVVIDRSGKVAYTGVGGEQDLEQAIRKVLQD